MSVLCYQLLKRLLLLPAVSTLSYSVCRVAPGRLCFSKMAEAAGQTFELVEVHGDLFTCPPTDGLVHCVSRDLRMGKGIAVLFKKKFGGVDELKKQGKRVGDVAVLQRNGRFIYYLITKERFSNKPTYDTLRSSLKAMKAHCQKNKVVRLSMPRIGCGLDKLDWLKVSELIAQVFSDSAMTITVYTI